MNSKRKSFFDTLQRQLLNVLDDLTDDASRIKVIHSLPNQS